MEQRLMAHGQNSGQERDSMLRRVAIVLSSLPPSVASKLVGSIAPDSKQEIHRAMTSLDDVDPLERSRAFHAFKVSIEQHHNLTGATQSTDHRATQQTNASNHGATNQGAGDTRLAAASRVVSGQMVREANSAPKHPDHNDSSSAPMSFIEEVDDQVLLRLLAGEHPQTVALVMASISPERAGRVLPQLDARTQTETLHRIGRLEGIPDTAIADVAEHFKQRIAQQSNQQSQSLGRTALDAILAAMPAQSRPSAAPNPPSAPQSASAPPTPAFPSADVQKQDLAQKIRLAEHTLPEPNDVIAEDHSHSGESRRQEASYGTAAKQVSDASSLNSTDAIAKHLESMAPADLCQALGRVDTRVAMLALCGLPGYTTDAALAVLPKAEAKRVRHAMNSIGALNLRDIDDAKEAVARAAAAARQHAPLAA
jgi:flagellar motor switch protein FliG